jgi:DNA-binding CsgD family transcriptional regulator
MMTHHDNAAHLARLLKVIADETRLRILGLLAEREQNGKEIGERLDLTPPTISHHMRKLVEAGIVTATPDAQQQIYALNSQLLLDARAKPIAVPAERRVEDEGDTARARVLANFFEGQQLKSIPARRKQRVIVLQHLLERFDPARTYSEPEVNDLLRIAHDDVATLRRELVDYGYMERERGIYQVSRHPPARSKQVAQEITGDEIAWLRSLIQTTISPQPASPDAEEALEH